MVEENREENISLVPWEPRRYVRKLDPVEVRLSRGFVRSRPEKWFPGLATQWLPLGHSLGVEIKITEVKPVITPPRGLEYGFAGRVDDEPVAILIDADSARVILEAVSPGSTESASGVVMEYMARRLLSSLGLSWSGPESSVVQFDSELDPQSVSTAGAIKLAVLVNSNACVVWIALGRRMVERLDGLWRRQVQSTTKSSGAPSDVHIEIAQLAVPPAMLVDYMRAGTVIDLEVFVSDMVVLRLGNKPWLPARLADVNGRLGFEIVPGPVASAPLPDGTTRLSIEFGKVLFEPATIAEMSQIGSTWESDITLSDQVHMVINGERVAAATLCLYEGRFAISVN